MVDLLCPYILNLLVPCERAKSFDNAAVFSEFVNFKDDISELGVELYINDELKQKGDVSMMINKPYEIIEDFCTFSSFEDGDILMSGTPSGVGQFKTGDHFIGKILHKDKVLLEVKFEVFKSH